MRKRAESLSHEPTRIQNLFKYIENLVNFAKSVNWVLCGLNGLRIRIRFQTRAWDFSHVPCVEADSSGILTHGKVSRACCWPLTQLSDEAYCLVLFIHTPVCSHAMMLNCCSFTRPVPETASWVFSFDSAEVWDLETSDGSGTWTVLQVNLNKKQ
jgi:hypothetical protein